MRRRLGVNIDHIATIRESRKVAYPNPFEALSILKECAVDQVTIHLREDRRHIQDHDLDSIIKADILPVNLEMAVTDEMVKIACQQKPKTATLVPEKREEVTTEGGLDCVGNLKSITNAVQKMNDQGIRTSLFIDPDMEQIAAAKESGAEGIEIHTGVFCNVIEDCFNKHLTYDYAAHSDFKALVDKELNQIIKATQVANEAGLKVYAGHGLHKDNLDEITKIDLIEEYNIGHSIIARAVFVGLKEAIKEIQSLLN